MSDDLKTAIKKKLLIGFLGFTVLVLLTALALLALIVVSMVMSGCSPE